MKTTKSLHNYTVKTKNPKDKIAAANPLFLDSLKKETSLSLDDHVLFELDGDNEIIACMFYINLDGELINPLESLTITADSLCKLYSDHTALRTSDNDILALQIFFGADENKKMRLFYQPISISLKETVAMPNFKIKEYLKLIRTKVTCIIITAQLFKLRRLKSI